MNKQEFAKIVQAWADGQEVEFRYLGSKSHGEWITEEDVPQWDSELEYRIKPKDVIEYNFYFSKPKGTCMASSGLANLKLTYTNGKLTDAEVLND